MRHLDDLICRDRRIGGKTERLYVLHDSFNVTAIIDVNGLVLERYGYDAFGTPRYMDANFGSRSSSNYDWETLYAGYRIEGETGLYGVRHRILHSPLGRFGSRDPIGEAGGLNPYDYVGNNSVNFIDKFGLVPCSCGEDVTFPLARTLTNISNTFAAWPRDKKTKVCVTIIGEGPAGFVDAWDILELAYFSPSPQQLGKKSPLLGGNGDHHC